MFFYEYCEFFKNTYFEKHLRKVASLTGTSIIWQWKWHKITARVHQDKIKSLAKKYFVWKHFKIWPMKTFSENYLPRIIVVCDFSSSSSKRKRSPTSLNKISLLTWSVIRTRPLTSPSNDSSFVVTWSCKPLSKCHRSVR